MNFTTRTRLWFGPLAVVLFFVGTFAIAAITPGYSHIRQTVSELGEVGSPGRFAFSGLLCLMAACLIVWAGAVARTMREMACSTLPAYFAGAMAISCAGVGIFAYPNPLHNVFGLSELVGLQAPLIAALACRKEPRARQIVVFSTAMYVVVLLAIAVNLVPIFRPASLWVYIKPFFGIVQRFLFTSWFLWCVGCTVLLLRADALNSLSGQARESRAA